MIVFDFVYPQSGLNITKGAAFKMPDFMRVYTKRAFPQGKQNGIFLIDLYLIYRRVMKIHLNPIKYVIIQTHKIFFPFCLRSFRVKLNCYPQT